MQASVDVQYGTCPCGGRFDSREVDIHIARPGGESPLVLAGVPQGVCPKCGSRVYKVHVLQYIESGFHRESGSIE